MDAILEDMLPASAAKPRQHNPLAPAFPPVVHPTGGSCFSDRRIQPQNAEKAQGKGDFSPLFPPRGENQRPKGATYAGRYLGDQRGNLALLLLFEKGVARRVGSQGWIGERETPDGRRSAEG